MSAAQKRKPQNRRPAPRGNDASAVKASPTTSWLLRGPEYWFWCEFENSITDQTATSENSRPTIVRN